MSTEPGSHPSLELRFNPTVGRKAIFTVMLAANVSELLRLAQDTEIRSSFAFELKISLL